MPRPLTERFWLVLADQSTMSTTVRHNCRESARREAERLATQNQGIRFFVAAVTGFAEAFSPPPPPPITWTELKKPWRDPT